MSFFAGLVKGTSEGISSAHERRRAAIAHQMEEAKAMSSVAKKRRAEADAVLQKIRNGSRRFGIDESVLSDVWKAGQLDNYLAMLDSADLTPAMRQQLWEVPKSVAEQQSADGAGSIEEQIYKAMGVVQQGVQSLPERNDQTVGTMLSRILGGHSSEDVQYALDGETIDGMDVNTLLDMPAPELPEATGGNYNYDVIKAAERAKKLRGRIGSGSSGPPRVTHSVGRVYGENMASDLRPELEKALRENLEGRLPDSTISDMVSKAIIELGGKLGMDAVSAGAITTFDVESYVAKSLTPEAIVERYAPSYGVTPSAVSSEENGGRSLPNTTITTE